ncbi:ATP-dependent DNA helicase [Histophilus somni]|uniref:ATP-dependent DNA helicase n=1 Tax=Histophilus somni TaxID=731 RepID=UPI00094ACB7A|nr:ATP-binding domain-containing protein [Histophilus somni]
MSENFSPLQSIEPDLYRLAKDAGHHLHSDPQSSLIKLRCFTEQFVLLLCKQLHIELVDNESLSDRMRKADFKTYVPKEIQQKLHLLRIAGNKAVHTSFSHLDFSEVADCLREAYLLGKWLYLNRVPTTCYPDFILPSPNHSIEQLQQHILSLKEENKKLNEHSQKIIAENAKLHLSFTELGEIRRVQAEKLQENTEKVNLESDKTLARLKKYRLRDCYSQFKLTDGQKTLEDQLDQFLADPKQHIFLLKGYAGTGKIFITLGLTDYLDLIERSYYLSAPTGKAARVISEKTRKGASTIHSAIYNLDKLVEYQDEKDPKTYKFYTALKVNTDISDCVYIIDESSMVSDVYTDGEFMRFGSGCLLKDLMEYINIDQNDHNKKIIFIGDNAQLPPIGMNNSPALDSKYLATKYRLNSLEYELTEVVRQKSGSGIIQNAVKIRECINKKEFNRLNMDLNYHDIHQIEAKDTIQTYLESCGHKINDESMIIACLNADVQTYNEAIRQYFFPDKYEICRGDKVMSLRNRKIGGVRIANGDFDLVRWVSDETETKTVPLKKKLENGEVETKVIELNFRDVEIGFRNTDGKAVFVKTKIIENTLYSKDPQLSSDEHKALYIDFSMRIRNERGIEYRKNKEEFKNAILSDPYFNALPLKFGYAITCHKAQGSEWNNVIVQCNNTHQNQHALGYSRWLYTAITRSSKQLYLIDPPKFNAWDKLKKTTPTSISPILLQPQLEKTEERPKMKNDQTTAPLKPAFNAAELSAISQLIYQTVSTTINNADIINIESKQYHDIYTVLQDQHKIRFKVAYNGKNQITHINCIENLQVVPLLESQLKTLEGKTFFIAAQEKNEITFSYDFLNEFHQQVIFNFLSKNKITICSVDEKQWNIRYEFANKSEGTATLDIYFNGKHEFTNIKPIQPKSTSNEFLETVHRLLMSELCKC